MIMVLDTSRYGITQMESALSFPQDRWGENAVTSVRTNSVYVPLHIYIPNVPTNTDKDIKLTYAM